MRVLMLSLLMTPLTLGCDGKQGKRDTGEASDAAVDTDTDTERSFLMGFTPFPYEASWDALTGVYGLIHDHGDFVAHHFDGGVPWTEALTGDAYPAAVNEELEMRQSLTDPLTPAYVALSALSIGRDELAPYWGEDVSMERTGDWATANFADPDVRTAYANFSVSLVDRFQPTWFNYAIEATDYLVHKPEQWNDFVGFAHHVHDAIKAEHPDVQLMISIALKHPDDPASALIRERFSDVLPYVDVVGVSVYPYAFFGLEAGGNPANLPEAWLSQISTIAPHHPIAIAETAWIAEDLTVDAARWSLDVESTAQWQADYVQTLCTEANALDAQFLTWFAVTDFDTLWEETLGEDPLAAIWRDTGLYDGELAPRVALAAWDAWHAKPVGE